MLPGRAARVDARCSIGKSGCPLCALCRLLVCLSQVTDSFPFPSIGDDDAEASEGESYQLEMMRCLREVNADNNMVGW